MGSEKFIVEGGQLIIELHLIDASGDSTGAWAGFDAEGAGESTTKCPQCHRSTLAACPLCQYQLRH
jgi:hypothetical protein